MSIIDGVELKTADLGGGEIEEGSGDRHWDSGDGVWLSSAQAL